LGTRFGTYDATGQPGPAATREGVEGMAAPRRTASEYEEQLRRQELAASRALMQALPSAERASVGQLTEARRALTRALRDLRGLRRELELDVRRLSGGDRSAPPGRAPAGRAPAPGRPGTPRRRPGELHRYQAALNAIDEVAERWEGRRAQLTSEIERRGGRG